VASYIAVLVDALQNHTERCNGYLEAPRKARSNCDWAQAEKLYLLAKEESQKSSDPMLLPQSLSDLAAMYVEICARSSGNSFCRTGRRQSNIFRQ